MQIPFTFDAGTAGAEIWAKRLAWLRRAVDVLGHKEVAYKLDVQPSHLTDALLERERKDVKARWFDVVLAMVSEPMRAEYLAILCDSLGYESPKRNEPKDDKAARRAEHAWLKVNAPAIYALMVKEAG